MKISRSDLLGGACVFCLFVFFTDGSLFIICF